MQTPEMVVSSRTNARVKQLRAAFQGHARLSGGMVAIEGDHLLEEALRSGMVLKTVFLSERRAVPKVVPRGVEVLRLTEEVFGSVVETQSPQGVAALMVPPVRTLADLLEGAGAALILIAVGLQDPGNMGTLVRSAEAFGANGVLTTPGTVSAWNQKALRASVGSVFRVPVAGVTASEIAELKGRGVRLIAAVGEDDFGVVAAREMDFSSACAVMIGNEGSGLAAEWMEMCDARVTIPCPGPVESLNAAVAGSLLLYEASRQRGGGKDKVQKQNTGILRSAQDDDIKGTEMTQTTLKQVGNESV
ncbi:TrmH family RNA methyltransferase [Tunturiibacter lichenicola]|uniref:TrmH family RNA methyltransferase n=1 Tax=Tunturiibacter lichenicola TaxID=2051959 RepID=UPI0021B48BE1|nr:RNA methyltransferase [Edaphobacter lichenicola]